MSVDRRRAMIEPDHPHLSVVRQCALVSLGRSTFYRMPMPDTAENLALMRLLDEQFLETPWYGSRQMMRHLRRLGHVVGRKRVRRLMARMGLAAIYQRPRTTVPHPEHRIYHRPPPLDTHRPDAFDKKSRSTTSCPILACSFSSSPSRMPSFASVLPAKTSARPSTAWRFHSLTIV